MQMELSEILEIAFKKLKGSVYFDKTQLVLRDKLVEYEGKGRVEEKIENIAELLEGDKEGWEKFLKKLLKSVDYLAFPKALEKDKSKVTLLSKEASIEKIQYMFDSSVEVQLLGMLWMLTIGVKLDGQLSEKVYGNRVRPTIVNEYENLTYSPYLLKPYFAQYESWRDSGLKVAEEQIDKNKDVIILTMDLKEFYYSVDIDKDAFDEFYNIWKSASNLTIANKIINRINKFVYYVIKAFSKKVKHRIDGEHCLPIGFLPSNIISNWYLNKFDSAINTKWNPLYYGRYVDDIIIVDKVEKNSFIYDMIEKKKCSNEEIIEAYLCNCKAIPTVKCSNGKGLFVIDEKHNQEDSEDEISEASAKSKNGIENETDYDKKNKKEYYINSELLINNKSTKMRVQNEKVKTFYFQGGGNKALLKTFRKAINQNRSEFRFMPGEDEYLIFEDYSDIYELRKDDGASVNKFREVSDVEINKFNLSKFLGKMLKVALLIDDRKENTFEKDIFKIFDEEKIIENFIFLETIIQQLLLNEHFEAAMDLVEKTSKAIKNVEISKELEKPSDEDEDKIKESLTSHLLSSINRAAALVWGKECKIFIEEAINILEIDGLINLKKTNVTYKKTKDKRKFYLETRMVNKYVTVGMVDGILNSKFEFNDEKVINLSNFNHYNKHIKDEKLSKYKFFPYLVKLQDIEFYKYIVRTKNLFESTKAKGKKLDLHILGDSKKDYKKLNYPNLREKNNIDFFENIRENNVCGDGIYLEKNIKATLTESNLFPNSKNRLTIAIANTMIQENDFEKVLMDKPNRSLKRYNNLRKIINDAIREKSDILVMPECYVPFEWLPLLAQKAAQNKIAIITGVEHLSINKKTKANVLNLTATILPYKVDEQIFSSHINLRNKVHYSPEEKRQIKGYGHSFIEGESYDLFCYDDFWFAVYCCFELASIHDRAIFTNIVDGIIAVEWNRDTKYYSNIIESLGRDLHCYCIQVNTSAYGDSRIVAPTESKTKDIVQVKGGKNDAVLTGEIDIHSLREFQLKEFELQKDDGRFKPTPPDFNKMIVKKKINKEMTLELIKTKGETKCKN